MKKNKNFILLVFFGIISLVIFDSNFCYCATTTSSDSAVQPDITSGDQVQSLFQEAKKLYSLQKFSEALDIFKDILAKKPSYTLASIYKKKCEYYLAQKQDSSQSSKQGIDTLHKKALEEAKGQIKKQEKREQQEIKNFYSLVDKYYKEGKILFSNEKYEEAIVNFNKVREIERDPRIKDKFSDSARRYIELALEKIQERPEMVTLLDKYDKYEKNLEKQVVEKQIPPETKEKVRIPVKPVPIFEAPAIKKKLQSKVSLDFQDVSLKFLLDYLAESTGANLALSTSASGLDKKITVKLKDVTCEEALKYVLKSAGLLYRLGENVVWIAAPEEMSLEQIETRIYKLKGGGDLSMEFSAITESKVGLSGGATIEKATTLKDIIKEAVSWPQGSSIVWDPRSSSLIVSNLPMNLEIVDELLYNLDVIPVQILIEARFIEIDITDLSELGIEWNLDSDAVLDRDKKRTNISLDKASGIDFTDYTRQAEGFNFVLKGVLTDPEFRAVIHALEERQNTKTLSSPRIMTLNNQEAAIKIVDEWIYPTRYEFEIVQYDSNGDGDFNDAGETQYKNVPKDFVKRDVGILLKVTPSLGEDLDTINLTLIPEVSEATANAFTFTGDVSLPKFSTRNLTTRIVTRNGETVVLGGLIKESRTKIATKVPLLGDLPFLGPLFRKERDSVERRNLIIFVTAKIIDPSGAEAYVSSN